MSVLAQQRPGQDVCQGSSGPPSVRRVQQRSRGLQEAEDPPGIIGKRQCVV